MDASTSEEPPPDSTDFAGWKRAADEERLDYLPLEAIFAALQDIRFNTDSGLRNALAKALSNRTLKLLRARVGRNHPNKGDDIIDRAHVQVFAALGQPDSADAKGYRQAFVARLMFRLKDAIAKEVRERRIPDETSTRHPPKSQRPASAAHGVVATDPGDGAGDADDDAAPSKSAWNPALLDGVRAADQQIYVDRFLAEHIKDDQKRLAFRLYMDDVPFKSKKHQSIAKALGIDEKTARLWIEELKAQLKAQLKERTGDPT